MSDEYRTLVAKVEAFTTAAATRRAADLSCRRGCDHCCHVWLTVSSVESEAVKASLSALPDEARARIAARGRRELERELQRAAGPRCAMLEDNGSCAIYDARPLVCRTQGHALRYPAGFIPAEAVRARTKNGDVTYCPLNFTAALPGPEDVLDAERVDTVLAVVNHRYAQARNAAPEERTSLSALAGEANVLRLRGRDERHAGEDIDCDDGSR